MAAALVCGMSDVRGQRFGQIRARTAPCRYPAARLAGDGPLKSPWPQADIDGTPRKTMSPNNGTRKTMSVEPVRRCFGEEPDPEPDQRNDGDDDRVLVCSLQTDNSTHMQDDVKSSRRQYPRTPSPHRQHFSIVTDSRAYMHAMQQMAFVPAGSDGFVENRCNADYNPYYWNSYADYPCTNRCDSHADYNPGYMHAMHQASFLPAGAEAFSPFFPDGSPNHAGPVQPMVDRTPSPQYRIQGCCVPGFASLADFIAPRTLPTVELPTMVSPLSPVGGCVVFSGSLESTSVASVVPSMMSPTMAVGPSCPDMDFGDVGLSMMSPTMAVGLSCPDLDFSPTMMPPSWPDLDFTLTETSYALPLTSLDDFLAPRTSVLLRGLPPCFTRSKLMEMFDGQGLALSVDFMYVPGNLKLGQNCGYAFVNFTSHEAAMACLEKLNGFSDWGVVCEVLGQGASVCEASWCCDRQGLHAHVEHYRNSRIMHVSVDDEYKPAMFTNGSRAFFPPPSKVIRAPRLRKA